MPIVVVGCEVAMGTGGEEAIEVSDGLDLRGDVLDALLEGGLEGLEDVFVVEEFLAHVAAQGVGVEAEEGLLQVLCTNVRIVGGTDRRDA